MKRDDQFWRTVNGNFLDHCVLEWVKLFADMKGQHHWRRIVSDPDQFEKSLLRALRLTPVQLDDYIKEMRLYRNKFVAHLDLETMMQIPRLRLARKSVAHLYDYILAHEDDDRFFPERPDSARRFYLLHVNLGREAYVSEKAL